MVGLITVHVMPRLPSHYAPELSAVLRPGGRLSKLGEILAARGALPTSDALAALLDLVYFASQTREEGNFAIFTVVIAEPGSHNAYLIIQEDLTVEVLRKMSAACSNNLTSLMVAWEAGRWRVWGIAVKSNEPVRSSTAGALDPHLVLAVDSVGALQLSLFHTPLFAYSAGFGSFPAPTAKWLRDLILRVLPADKLQYHHLQEIQKAMAAHGRGGTLLIVPQTVPAGIKIRYRCDPRQAPLAREVSSEIEFRSWSSKPIAQNSSGATMLASIQRHSVDATDAQAALIGRLTAVDGVVILDHEMRVHGFGGKVDVPRGASDTVVFHVATSDQARTPTTAATLFSGMRHVSAVAACVAAGPGSLALVQSQDGTLTILINDAGALLAVRPLETIPSY